MKRQHKRWVMATGLLLAMLLAGQPIFAIELGDHFQGYVSDKRAFGVGDSLTLLVMEDSSAQTAKGSTAGRDISLSGGYTDKNDGNRGSVSLGYGNQADNGSQQSGSLKAAITATITEKTSQGLLKVEGKQKITVDGKKQRISVSGWIRQEDISRENTVLSTRLSDANIRYTGFEKRMGFFARLFDWM